MFQQIIIFFSSKLRLCMYTCVWTCHLEETEHSIDIVQHPTALNLRWQPVTNLMTKNREYRSQISKNDAYFIDTGIPRTYIIGHQNWRSTRNTFRKPSQRIYEIKYTCRLQQKWMLLKRSDNGRNALDDLLPKKNKKVFPPPPDIWFRSRTYILVVTYADVYKPIHIFQHPSCHD